MFCQNSFNWKLQRPSWKEKIRQHNYTHVLVCWKCILGAKCYASTYRYVKLPYTCLT